MSNLTDALTGMGRVAEAEAVSAEACAQYRLLAASQPGLFTVGLAGTLSHRAALLRRLNRPAEADAAAAEAAHLRESNN